MELQERSPTGGGRVCRGSVLGKSRYCLKTRGPAEPEKRTHGEGQGSSHRTVLIGSTKPKVARVAKTMRYRWGEDCEKAGAAANLQ